MRGEVPQDKWPRPRAKRGEARFERAEQEKENARRSAMPLAERLGQKAPDYMEPPRKKTQAEIVRSQLWDIPKTVLPFQEWETVHYKDRDKTGHTRELVALKAGNTQKMIMKARRQIAKGVPKQARLFRMMRRGREKFGIDIVSERTYHGIRAFKYRSGMRDLREDPSRKLIKEKGYGERLPEHRRKRARWRALLLKRRPSRPAGNKQGYVR